MTNPKLIRKVRRQRRIRSKINGTPERPRVTLFRSNKFIYAQVIDDAAAKTVASYSSAKLKEETKITKTEQARKVGVELGAILKKTNISKVVFDRGSFAYKGRVQAVAEGLRESGIEV